MSYNGYRISPALSFGGIRYVKSSLIEWASVIPANTTLVISAGLSQSDAVQPGSYSVCTRDQAIPGLFGRNVTNQYLWLKQEMTSEVHGTTPRLDILIVTINGESYVQTGRAFQRLFRGIVGGWDLSGDNQAKITLTNEMVLWNKEPLRIQSTACPWAYKGTECSYSGPMGPCDKSYEACQLRGNEAQFGGDRFLAAAMTKELWWGRTRNYMGT